jgi:methyltransferase
MSSVPAFMVFLTLVGLLRAVELVVSQRRLHARPHAHVEEPALFPLMAVLHAGVLLLPPLEVALLDRPFVPALCVSAAVVLALATVLRVWTLRTIGRSWNVRVVAPDEDAIATSGPYAWIRHPNYLVVVLEVLALPLLHTAWLSSLALSLLNAAVLARRVATEEATLSASPTWCAAMKGKARLIPGLV